MLINLADAQSEPNSLKQKYKFIQNLFVRAMFGVSINEEVYTAGMRTWNCFAVSLNKNV